MHIARLFSIISSQRFLSALIPLMHLSANTSDARPISSIDCKRLWLLTGIITFNSKFPNCPPIEMVKSFPITWAATWHTASGITGLTFPGMIEDPGWTGGINISPIPHLGPLPSHLISFAIFIRLTARVLREPLASTTASLEPWASKWLSASLNLFFVALLSLFATNLANLGCVFIPVPTAVPPIASSDSSCLAYLTLLIPCSIMLA